MARSKKSGSKKPAAKKAAAKKSSAKKPAATKPTTKKAAASAAKKASAAKAAAKKPGAAKKTATGKRPSRRPTRKVSAKVGNHADPSLFLPFTVGERADALRILTEDKRLASMAKVGRYRVISVEPSPVKAPESLVGHRLATVIVYDYSQDRCVEAHVDLDTSDVVHLRFSKVQPMLAREEEAAAISVALTNDEVKKQLSLGDQPQVAMHYWSTNDTDSIHNRRAAAVVFGQPGDRPSVVAVVDLVSNEVAEVVSAEQW